jgi:adenylate cyclase
MSFFSELKRRQVVQVGVGYLLVAWGVAQVAELVLDSFETPAWIIQVILIGLAVGFPIAITLSWVFDLRWDGLHRESPLNEGNSDSKTSTQKTNHQSIAVLPFADMSSGKDQEYFSDGISEELLNLLTKIPQLFVAARTSSFSFKGKDTDIRGIGQLLGVAYVLEGSVRKAGSTIRITAQLISAKDGYHLWSETWDRSLKDIFAVQDEIAAIVVEKLKVHLLSPIPTVKETNPEAYALYLQAQYFTNSGQGEIIEKALPMFIEVTELDPDYAPAWVGLADTYRSLMSFGLQAKETGIDLAFGACNRALVIDDLSAEAHVCRAVLCAWFKQDWSAASDAMNRAMQIAPGNALVLLQAGNQASNQGKVHESTALLKRAIELDPLNTTGHIWLSHSLIALDRLSEARDILLQALSLIPQRAVAHMNLGKILLVQGKAKAAHEEMLKEPEGVWRDYGLTESLFAIGRFEEAEQAHENFVREWSDEAGFQIAELHAFRNEIDDAFRWLDRAHEVHDNGLTELFESLHLRVLYDDRRWPVFVKKMGLEWPLS